MKLSAIALSASVTLVTLAASAVPALATDGRTAVGLCIDRGAACRYTVDSGGGIDIYVDGHWISCISATGECQVMSRTKGGKPKPTGANVNAVMKS